MCSFDCNLIKNKSQKHTSEQVFNVVLNLKKIYSELNRQSDFYTIAIYAIFPGLFQRGLEIILGSLLSVERGSIALRYKLSYSKSEQKTLFSA